MVRSDIKEFIKSIPNDVVIVAATKYVDVNDMTSLLEAGLSNFGENRVESFLAKYQALSFLDITWHFIGHLQRNKAKKIINYISYLHSLDSLELADLINKYRNTPLNVFIEVSINLEESKNGVPYYEVESFINKIKDYKNINIVGLMMMAIKDSEDTYSQFLKLKNLRDELINKCHISIPYLSMGMSDDYLYALKAGATHIRLGRILYKSND